MQQIIEKLCLETEITTDKNLDTVFDCLLLHKCNSLGLARTFSALLLYFDINSVVVGGLSMQNKEQYWNIVQYDPMSEVIMIPLNIKGTRELTVYSCVDLYQSIINKVATYIPSYHINVSSERINIDHTPILYFGYPETVQFNPVYPSVCNSAQLREVLRQASYIMNKSLNSETCQKTYFIDLLIDFGLSYEETFQYLRQSKADISTIILRYAPNFEFVDIIEPHTNTPVVSLEFVRREIQDFILYPDIVSAFDQTKLDSIVQFVMKNFGTSRVVDKLVIPLNTDIPMNQIVNTFQEDILHRKLMQCFFRDSTGLFDSCVYRYTLSGHYIVIVFISIPVYNSVPKSARRNKLSLNRNQLYIYANVISALMKRLDECVVSYVEELPEHQYTKIFNSIRLDYPELFFMPRQ